MKFNQSNKVKQLSLKINIKSKEFLPSSLIIILITIVVVNYAKRIRITSIKL